MKKHFAILVIFIFLGFYIFIPAVKAANSSDVVINEIAWMGTTVSPNDEWIELYNNTNNAINLDGWVLKSDDKTPEIQLTGIIPANSFYLLERTDDTTLPNVNADLIYTGALENDGENLKLYDNLNNLVDEANCSSGWSAGDNATEQTMERIPTGWQTSENPGGTPKSENSKQLTENKEQITENSLPIIYPTGIVFNEILPSPEGADETEEWFEIYNDNNFEVDLSNWKIQDSAGTITTFIFPNGTKIEPKGYLILNRPQTKITMNNSGDKLVLFRPDGNIADSAEFEKALLNFSYNRLGSEWKWSDKLTPGEKNIIESNPSPIGTEIQKQSDNDNIDDKIVADLTKGVENAKPFSFLFFGAILLAIILVIIFFLLKTKFRKKY